MHLPCDDVLPGAKLVVHRAVDVDAPPEAVFRWLCQLKVAPYSYDWIDNLGRRSPRELTPGAERLERGQRVMKLFRLVDFERDRQITVDWRGEFVVTYAVLPGRLYMRVLGRRHWPLFRFGDLIMARKQLLTLAELAREPG